MPKKSWKKCHKFQEIGATKTHVGCIGVSRQNTTKMQTVHLRKSVMGCCYIVIACGTYEYKWKTVNVLRQKLRALPGTTDWASLALENTADNQRPNHLQQATSNSRTNDQWTHKKKTKLQKQCQTTATIRTFISTHQRAPISMTTGNYANFMLEGTKKKKYEIKNKK